MHDAPGVLRQEDRRLAGRVAGADDVDLLVAAAERLGRRPSRSRCRVLRTARCSRPAAAATPGPSSSISALHAISRAVPSAPGTVQVLERRFAAAAGRRRAARRLRPRICVPASARGARDRLPEMPGGKAEVVLDPARVARLPAGPSRSIRIVFRPSDAAYTAAARPAGPGADNRDVVDVALGLDAQADLPREVAERGRLQAARRPAGSPAAASRPRPARAPRRSRSSVASRSKNS